jgi:conjugal transfer pilin signal peptidase TrbI
MKKEYLKIAIFLMIFAQGIYTFKQSYGVGFSVTPSLPYYVFLIDKKHLSFKKNDLIVFKYPGENIYNYKKDEQFVKIASCFPGDNLEVKDFEYFCNAKSIGIAFSKDGKGKELKPFIFSGIIPKNEYFVVGTHPKSWDSKYWGFVSKERIVATAKGLI